MNDESIGWWLGPLWLSRSLLLSAGVTALLVGVIPTLRRHSLVQLAVEGALQAMRDTIESVVPGHGDRLLPFLATLWLYLITANLLGLVPGLSSPTADLSITAALATIVFFSVHWFGWQEQGWKYLRHYLQPSPLLLPFHLVAEVTRTLALAVRLFGNMMSLELTAALVLLVAGFLAPVPILLLHVVEALVQSYIFGVLALVYIAGGVHAQQPLEEQHA